MQNIFRITLALALLPLTASPSRASAQFVSYPVISEIQTGTALGASQEFIELYNPTGKEVSLEGWSVDYKSATSVDIESSWSKKATLRGIIPAYGFYLMAPKTYIGAADAEWSATLAASGGTIRLKDSAGTVVDQLGYGVAANAAEGSPAAAPEVGASIERAPGPLAPGNGIDTNDNMADFSPAISDFQNSESSSEVPEASKEESEVPLDEPVSAPLYRAVTIHELLVDPLSPLTDAEDEFIELHNPTADSINLKGYVLRCGSNFRDYYELPNMEIAAGGYLVLYAHQTKLGLTNSGGAVQLLDPSGTVIDRSPFYENAPAGQSWAAFDDGWHWTLQLTPGQPNKLAALPSVSAGTSNVRVKTTPKKMPAKVGAKLKKVPAPKTLKPKKAKKVKPAPATLAAIPAATSHNLQPATWLIISLAVLTIGYALYEFRYDIQNLYFRFRRNHPNRKDDRSSVKGRERD